MPDNKYDATTIESLYNSLFTATAIDNQELIDQFMKTISEYEQTSTQLSLWIMRKVLKLAEEGKQNNAKYIEDDVEQIKKDITDSWKKVTVMKLRYGVALKRKGELYA